MLKLYDYYFNYVYSFLSISLAKLRKDKIKLLVWRKRHKTNKYVVLIVTLISYNKIISIKG